MKNESCQVNRCWWDPQMLLHHTRTSWLLSRSLSHRAEAQPSRTPASRKAVGSDWIIYFTSQINFYSLLFLMLSLAEETRLSVSGSQRNQLSQQWDESFIYKLTLHFLKEMVLAVLNQTVRCCVTCTDRQDLMLYDATIHLGPMGR